MSIVTQLTHEKDGVVVGEFRNKPMISFGAKAYAEENGRADQPFTFGVDKARKVCEALNHTGLVNVAYSLFEVAGIEPSIKVIDQLRKARS